MEELETTHPKQVSINDRIRKNTNCQAEPASDGTCKFSITFFYRDLCFYCVENPLFASAEARL